MVNETIALQRLRQQRLVGDFFETPEAVVAWLGAVQAQDYYGALWSLGMRMGQTDEDLIEQAFNAGRILRIHMMRPTWHFVTPADIGWIMALTAPRVHAANAYMVRQLALDDRLLMRCNDIIARALEGGQFLTRKELGAKLADAAIDAKGQRLAYIVHRAELDRVVCSGPRRGKQFTYALFDERAAEAQRLTRDEALAELTRRYFMGHGPATLHDFSWWSGLTVSDAKAGIEMLASDLDQIEIDEQRYWFPASGIAAAKAAQHSFLLPTYDEYFIGYSAFGRTLGAAQETPKNLVFDSTIMMDGHIVGTWRRSIKKQEVVIELALSGKLSVSESEALRLAAARYAAFIGKTAQVSYALRE